MPNSKGSKAFMHPSDASVFSILMPNPGGLICTSSYAYPSVNTSSHWLITGDVTSRGLTHAHFSSSVPAFRIEHACPRLLHLYSEHPFKSSLHFSQSSPPVGGCHGKQLKLIVCVFSFL